MALQWGDPPLKDFPARYTRRLVLIEAAAVIVGLVGIFVFRTAWPLLFLLLVFIPGPFIVYWWWRKRAPGTESPATAERDAKP